ncbi:hypothetical protein OsJ_01029 [Oryza sativa Japonica Group]|uniref:Uncharacterized protein n=1 Tax=Oryza sativa subsp. japonica TaxID=39947 RepID=B9EUK3_ORYSJ|nr:hypothetical protein OsJ_01029 [Oryza sativa Japonica Group]
MGCAGSKDVTVADVYRPPPTSVSLFDISAIEEPWLIATGKKNDEEEEEEDEEEEEEEEEEEGKKPTTTVMPLPLLDKLDGYDLAPASWSEVSKALEDIKPALSSNTTTTENAKKKTKKKKKKQPAPPPQPPTTTTTVLPEPVKAIEAAAKKAAAAPARGEACAAKDGRGCEGCGGARFVPCWECGGSCKVVAAGATAAAADVERCAKCNENGLMLCPICH